MCLRGCWAWGVIETRAWFSQVTGTEPSCERVSSTLPPPAVPGPCTALGYSWAERGPGVRLALEGALGRLLEAQSSLRSDNLVPPLLPLMGRPGG